MTDSRKARHGNWVENGSFYSDAEILDIRTRAFMEARKYAEAVEFQLAEQIAETRRHQEDLALCREKLRTAELLLEMERGQRG